MGVVSRIATPFVALLGASTDLVLRALGVRPAADEPVTEEEVSILIEQGTRAGVFDAAEGDIVESVFRLNDRPVSSLMTPRADVVWLDIDAPREELCRTVLQSGHSRFPVCRGGLDDVLGVVTTANVLTTGTADVPLDLRALMHPATFLPETVTAFRAIESFKRSGEHLAIVIDEYGTSLGIITVFDILEALVGGIPSPEEAAEPPIVRRADGSWLLDGALAVEEVKEALEVDELPGERDGDYRTLGGLAMFQLGRVPTAGDHFDWNGLRFEVVDMDGRRVDKVLVAATPSDAEAPSPTS
jgi:putative hemolysin